MAHILGMSDEIENVAVAWTLYFDFSFYSMNYKIFLGILNFWILTPGSKITL